VRKNRKYQRLLLLTRIVVVVDLERVTDAVSDDTIKNIQLTYKIDVNSTFGAVTGGSAVNITYNIMYIIEYQQEAFIDRVTGQVIASDQV
jgi:hypothetical protein